ncbi:MAG: PolC-type DNA polymerase III, partial [Oscillospiraceae bacterium]|nr:PolC-type DNA polymerase III [Oscillospiraceae bacterium]
MFAQYRGQEEVRSLLAQTTVQSADIDPATRRISVALLAEKYISQKQLERVREEICAIYGLQALELQVTFAAQQLHFMDGADLMNLFVEQNPMARGTLAGASWVWDAENTLMIKLRGNGKAELEACTPAVKSRIHEMFSEDIAITIVAENDLEGKALFDALEEMRSSMILQMPKAEGKAQEQKAAPRQDSDAIFGKSFKAQAIPMSQLELNMGFVCVEGRVFNIEHKELPKRNAWVINFDVTDTTSSVRVSRFLEKKEADPIITGIKKGSVVKIQGKLMIDNYTNEMVLKPANIIAGSMPKRVDKAEGAKRVELHMHTTMSNMDALTNTDAAIKQAAAWGHKAIAITDHGCVQSFTDALHTVEAWGGGPKVAGTDEVIKILYGCEGYFVNDVDDRIVVHGEADMTFDREFVAFDLETTGLSSRDDRIIEIGAVRMRGGEELDRFQTFVDPERSLDSKIVELTGITDRMLVGAPKIEEVLPKFLEFVGDSVLVAHNADFDTGFIRAACQQQGLSFNLTSADTLVLAQNLMPQLGKFKLDIVANALSLPEFNHHRAADDAVTCGMIMARFLDMLKEQGVENLQAINPAMEGLRAQTRINERHARHIILFAKNQMGLRNLYHLISDSNLKFFKRVPRIPKSELMKLREGLIIGSACEAGELFQAIIDGKSEDELKRIASFYDYLEIQPLSNNRFMLAKGIVQEEEELREFNRTVVRLGELLNKPVVATGDVHFLNPEDEIFRHILLATKGFDDCDKPNPLYLRTTDEMLEEFSYLGAEKAYEVVVTNPNLIADMCENVRPVPHNLFAPKIENSVEDLKALVYGKMHRLYGENPPELIQKRVDTELNDIISCHYDVIYMSAQKLVQNSLEHGYLVGSRGSVGSSIVAYMSGITEVNSFPPHYRCPNPDCKHTTFDVPKGFECGADLPDDVCPKCGTQFEKDGFNIPFETFLGFGGDKVPDIDLNFSGEYQAKAHAYCTELFGKSHVFRAGTVGTVAEKTAFGYVKKYMSERGKTASKAEEGRLANG